MKIERESMVAVVRVFSFSIAGHLDKACPSENFFEVIFLGRFPAGKWALAPGRG